MYIKSLTKDVNNGVPQGSGIEPLLNLLNIFLLYLYFVSKFLVLIHTPLK